MVYEKELSSSDEGDLRIFFTSDLIGDLTR
jgi:hypothetical protein